MSEYTLGAPSRKMDEFEELVYEYTSRMGLGDEGVSSIPDCDTTASPWRLVPM